jgi:hypothetical protein
VRATSLLKLHSLHCKVLKVCFTFPWQGLCWVLDCTNSVSPNARAASTAISGLLAGEALVWAQCCVASFTEGPLAESRKHCAVVYDVFAGYIFG